MKFERLIVVLVGIIILAGVGMALFDRTENAPSAGNAAETSSSTPQAENATFSQSFTTGFEGVNTDATYSFDYSPAILSAHADPSDPKTVLITDKRTGAENSIKIFWNGAAGIENPEAYWNDINPCLDCPKTGSGVATSSDEHTFTYEDSTDEWSVGSWPPDFFIVTHFVKPSADMREVWSTFRLDSSPSASKTMPPEADTSDTSSSTQGEAY